MNEMNKRMIERSRVTETQISAQVSAIEEIVRLLIHSAKSLQAIRDSGLSHIFENLIVSFPKNGIDFRKATESYEINLITQALRRTNGNQTQAAELLNLKNSTLHSMMKRHNLKVADRIEIDWIRSNKRGV